MTHEERLEILSNIETGCVTDAMAYLNTGKWMSGIYPTNSETNIFGRAVTVQFEAVENPEAIIDQFQLVDMCKPTDVLVWSVPSEGNIIGENIMHFAENKGLNGIIIDGYTRDVNIIAGMPIPEFTKGKAIAPAPRNMRSRKELINIPVECGGITVQPGDYIFGDNDGVLVVPEKDIDRVLAQALLNMDAEKKVETVLNAHCSLEELKAVIRSKKTIE